ncbi:hypothetical protein VP01_843g5 [Puccinia sorghi]|uniref:Uncharacterized protein n=1 Tax=Puccinia sorghi TaxID=27349 RepID=A0A0L6U9F2_9BASI|nr:hypothetical protein VP01_843g5 [Puccinia sorghi]
MGRDLHLMYRGLHETMHTQKNAKLTSTENKIKQISVLIERLNWEPKRYMVQVWNTTSAKSIFKQRIWGSTGWEGTRKLMDSIKGVVVKYRSSQIIWN